MSQMSNLSQVLDEMISCGEGLIKAATELKEIFSESAEMKTISRNKAKTESTQPEPLATTADKLETEQKKAALPKEEAEKPATPKTESQGYSFEEVRKACAAKSHAGFTNEVRELIHKYGADRLSGIKQEAYPSLMQDLEVIR